MTFPILSCKPSIKYQIQFYLQTANILHYIVDGKSADSYALKTNQICAKNVFFKHSINKIMSMVVIDIFLSWYTYLILSIIDLKSSFEKSFIPTSIPFNLFRY